MPRRLNILWSTDHCCYDGILHAGGRLFLDVIPRLDPERFRVVPTMTRSSDEVRAIFEASPLDVDIFDVHPKDLRTIYRFYDIVRREKIDVMHLHCYGTSTFGRIASVFTGTPTIIHDYDTDHYFKFPKYMEIVDKLLEHRTSGAIASNPMVRRFTIERRSVTPSKIRLMFHPILPERFEPVPESDVADMRAKLEIPDGVHVVGAITKLAPDRGNDVLVNAMAQVLKALPDTILVMVHSPTEFHRTPRGYSPETHTLRKDDNLAQVQAHAEELGIASRIRFYETYDVPPAIEAMLDVLAAPFLDERFSCARLLDAMPKGVPILASDIGEHPEIIENGVNGYLVEAGSAGDLADKLIAVLSKPEHREKLRAGARERAQEFHLDHYVKSLEDWYTELAKAG